MKTQVITLTTHQPIEVLDLTSQVKNFVKEQAAQNGILVIASEHTTLGVVLNEKCDSLEKDMTEFLNRLAPADLPYRHNQVAVDGRPNAHSHLLSLVIPSQQTLVIENGSLQLGQWQSVFAVELDGPRPLRKVHLTLITV